VVFDLVADQVVGLNNPPWLIAVSQIDQAGALGADPYMRRRNAFG
jgi:hypothetical protein